MQWPVLTEWTRIVFLRDAPKSEAFLQLMQYAVNTLVWLALILRLVVIFAYR
jgi:hypothetical protein